MKITEGDSITTSATDVQGTCDSVTDEKNDDIAVVEVATDRLLKRIDLQLGRLCRSS